jgi:hypothetical protein
MPHGSYSESESSAAAMHVVTLLPRGSCCILTQVVSSPNHRHRACIMSTRSSHDAVCEARAHCSTSHFGAFSPGNRRVERALQLQPFLRQ